MFSAAAWAEWTKLTGGNMGLNSRALPSIITPVLRVFQLKCWKTVLMCCHVSCLLRGCNPTPTLAGGSLKVKHELRLCWTYLSRGQNIIFEHLSSFVFRVQLHGTLRVVMEPLLGDMPLVGALSVFFLKKPVSTLTFDPPPPLHCDQNDIPPAAFHEALNQNYTVEFPTILSEVLWIFVEYLLTYLLSVLGWESLSCYLG